MLPRINRLPSHIRLSRPRMVRTSLFILKYSQNSLDHNRFAFLVRKKTEHQAVKRNRIKRLFRSCIETSLTELAPGYDMLFLLERDIQEKRQDELCAELKQVFAKYKLLK